MTRADRNSKTGTPPTRSLRPVSWRLRKWRDKESVLVQAAVFEPRGMLGLFYWYALLPLHALIFSGLCNAIAERAEGLKGRKNLMRART